MPSCLRISRHARLTTGDAPGERAGAPAGRAGPLGGLPATLRELACRETTCPALARDAAKQWTGTFNPRPFDAAAALHLYERAY